MATPRKSSETSKPRRRPATTPEAQENYMISLTVKLAEKQLKDGSASSQVMTHFLKLATTREKLEQEKLKKENLLLQSRAESLVSDKENNSDYRAVLNALQSYKGEAVDTNDEYED